MKIEQKNDFIGKGVKKMENKLRFFEGFPDEEKPIENCCQCGEKACVRSYGGEIGDYCFDCHFEMLKRING